jgi:hypothetical protein
MKRAVSVAVLVLALSGLSGPAQADPEPSCLGILAPNANPNNGFAIHEIVMPLAEELGITMGALQSSIAQTHGSTIPECLP